MRMATFPSFLFAAILSVTSPAYATADGPDYFRVDGVGAGSFLNLRAGPSRTADRIGHLPPTADSLKNLGCRGGLSLADFQVADAATRAAARKTRWCKVAFRGQTGWAAGWHLAEGSAPTAPSFNCATADANAEKLICGDADLAALDRETDRLYRLALTGEPMDAVRALTLREMQRDWIKGRNDCWKSRADLRPCIVDSYLLRIHEIRTDDADARADDAESRSLGPFAYACKGFDARLSAVFVSAGVPRLSLHWREHWLTLEQARSASGARYVGSMAKTGDMEFWIKGKDATWSRSGDATLACSVEAPG